MVFRCELSGLLQRLCQHFNRAPFLSFIVLLVVNGAGEVVFCAPIKCRYDSFCELMVHFVVRLECAAQGVEVRPG